MNPLDLGLAREFYENEPAAIEAALNRGRSMVAVPTGGTAQRCALTLWLGD
jgi:hypothetical protein